jgi:hypothetical protein
MPEDKIMFSLEYIVICVTEALIYNLMFVVWEVMVP